MEGYPYKQMVGWKSLFILVLCAVILAGGFIYVYVEFETRFDELNSEIASSNSQIAALQRLLQEMTKNVSDGLDATQIYNLTKDSVVMVENRIITPYGMVTAGVGSGFVYDVRGTQAYIVTNHHVVEDAVELRITFLDGTVFVTHRKWSDPYTDLAVIEITKPLEKTIYPLVIGNSTELRVGEEVYAIGNPYQLEGTMTHGIVSQLGRSIRTATGYSIVDVIQFDAAVNPGNSGGPLLNRYGMVVGVTTAIETETGGFVGIGYAVSSALVQRVIPALIEEHQYKHPWVGIKGVDMNYEIADAMDTNYTYGFLITEVMENSPAEDAGLRGGNRNVIIEGTEIPVGGDIIIGVDALTVRKADDLMVYLERNKSPGDKIVLTIVREGAVQQVELWLGERPPP